MRKASEASVGEGKGWACGAGRAKRGPGPKVLVAVVVLGGVAYADPDVDPSAEQAGEANLVSNAPREGMTYAGALGGGMIISKGKTASVPTLDLRLGHVANARTIVTVELVGGTYTHKLSMTGATLIDSQLSFLVGAQIYIAPSVWLRGAGGVGTHTTDDGSGQTPHGGLTMGWGAGVDLIRWHYVVLGIEGFYTGTFAKGGYTSLGGIGLGLTHY